MTPLHIENLNQYIDALHACSLGIFSFETVAQSAQVSLSNIEHLIQWDDSHYVRISVEKTDDFELLLLCWEPGQHTQIHNHNGAEGWIKVIQGHLYEEIFTITDQANKLHPASQKSMLPGRTFYINDQVGIHRMTNNSDERSISLHLYVKPVESISVYDEATGDATRVVLASEINS